MSENSSQSRIYLTTPTGRSPETLVSLIETLLSTTPVACLRIDLGTADETTWRRMANALIGPCHSHDVALTITDHYRLVLPLGLDGVHLSDPHIKVRDVREQLTPEHIVGANGGATRHRAIILAEAGADYVSLGPVGETGALGSGARAEDDLFCWWAEMIETPVVAEGGVSLKDAERLADFADFIVPGADLWDAHDPVAVLRAYADILR